jgi:hypothetical protein
VTAPQLESVVQNATATLTDWNAFIGGLSSLEGPEHVAFDLEKPIPSINPSTSVGQIGTKLTGAIALAHNLSAIESLDLIPDSIVTEVTARVSAVRTGVEKLLAQISALEKDSEIASLDPASMIAANQKNQQLNLPPIFVELYPAIQILLSSLYQIRTMSKLNERAGYTEVFRLKTQYTYKYAVAASLPSFKIEAPNFADAITALAFKELLFNPGEKVDAPEDKSSDASGGSTFIQRLIEPIVKKAMDKIGDATKSPV